MLTPQFVLALSAKLVIDLFAGGGGASTGIEQTIGRPVDIAINHDADAIGMHEANHPQTRHYRADIWEVCPRQATGGQPRSKEIRSLAWVVPRRGGIEKPDVITLENVEQMLLWCRLIAKRCPETGRVVTLDKIKDAKRKITYRVADPGERVPRHNQYLVPDKKQLGKTWNRFVQMLRNQGYVVQWRVLCNADVGCKSTRTRLYMIARRDGLPIVWPEKTHAKKPVGKLKPHKWSAECIDWSIPGTSIFGRKKDLAEATMRRIAHGMQKYVIGSKDPFIALAAANAAFIIKFNTGSVGVDLREPVPTVTAGGNPVRPGTGTTIGLVAASLVQMGYGEREGQEPRALDRGQVLGTVVAGGNKFATASVYLVQAGHGEGAGATKRRSHGANNIREPIGTITASGDGQSLATAFMVQANGGFNSTPAKDLREGMSTVTTSGSQQQLITAKLEQQSLSPEHEVGALRCAAFLMRYHGCGGQWADLREPMTTVTTHDRLALVTVWLKGEPWVIVDITLRMLVPRELYNAQDFPPSYIIDRTAAGKPLTKTARPATASAPYPCGSSWPRTTKNQARSAKSPDHPHTSPPPRAFLILGATYMQDKNPLAHYSGVLSEAVQESAGVPDQAQIKALMRKHRIWIEHSTMLEDDLPARELRAVQAEQHQFEAFVQDLIVLSAAKTTHESDYLEGVSIPNLREALIFLGRESGVGEDEVGDKLAQYVNSVVSGVLSKKAAPCEAPQAAAAAAAALLEALESIVDVCEGHDFDGAPSDAHMEKARTAISAYRAALAATPAAAKEGAQG